MLKIIFLCGLPGSGKTTYGNELAKYNARFIDDISLIGRFNQLEEAIEFLVPTIIIADVFLCRAEEREKAVKTINRLCAKYKTKYKTECKTEYEVEWIFFENNPEKCLKNGRRAGRSIRVDRPRIC